MNTQASRIDPNRLLVMCILDPRLLLRLRDRDWERLLSCARRNRVLAYLAERAETDGVMIELPEVPRASMLAARTSALRLAQLARWELDRVRRALRPLGVPVIALKGVAYIVRALPHSATRLISDIDVMVPYARVDAAERALLGAGWKGSKLDPYDQKYYRDWSHELPPLHYPGRLLGVDVHHTICPPISRLRPDRDKLWTDSEPSTMPGVFLLSSEDTFLHAAVHLFFDSDFDTRFRELIDLHELVAAFEREGRFWPNLLERARSLGLGRPLYYALTSLSQVVRTSIPQTVMHDVAAFAPPQAIARWMSGTLEKVLTPVDPEPWPPRHRFRLWLLYVRSLWLRMPAHLLVPHLLRKALRRPAPEYVDA